MGRHLGIDFLAILVDFEKQVGIENRTKLDPKRNRKSDEYQVSGYTHCLLRSNKMSGQVPRRRGSPDPPAKFRYHSSRCN